VKAREDDKTRRYRGRLASMKELQEQDKKPPHVEQQQRRVEMRRTHSNLSRQQVVEQWQCLRRRRALTAGARLAEAARMARQEESDRGNHAVYPIVLAARPSRSLSSQAGLSKAQYKPAIPSRPRPESSTVRQQQYCRASGAGFVTPRCVQGSRLKDALQRRSNSILLRHTWEPGHAWEEEEEEANLPSQPLTARDRSASSQWALGPPQGPPRRRIVTARDRGWQGPQAHPQQGRPARPVTAPERQEPQCQPPATPQPPERPQGRPCGRLRSAQPPNPPWCEAPPCEGLQEADLPQPHDAPTWWKHDRTPVVSVARFKQEWKDCLHEQAEAGEWWQQLTSAPRSSRYRTSHYA